MRGYRGRQPLGRCTNPSEGALTPRTVAQRLAAPDLWITAPGPQLRGRGCACPPGMARPEACKSPCLTSYSPRGIPLPTSIPVRWCASGEASGCACRLRQLWLHRGRSPMQLAWPGSWPRTQPRRRHKCSPTSPPCSSWALTGGRETRTWWSDALAENQRKGSRRFRWERPWCRAWRAGRTGAAHRCHRADAGV